MLKERVIDLMYLACNRLEFTRETFTTLLANTDWRYVHELFVYDDGSQDGTREWLEKNASKAPVPSRFVKTHYGSPVAAMVHFIESATAPILTKTDNDAMLPSAWLRQSLEVFDRHPELAFLGIEAMYPHQDDVNLIRSYTPAEFISGLGLYRRAAFARSTPTPYQKWFGLEEWQMAQGSSLVRGWITPAIPVFLLDRFPFEPWTAYCDSYIKRGWQRSWPKYDPACTLWHWRWPAGRPAAPHAATKSIQGCSKLSYVEEWFPELPEVRFSNKADPALHVIILSARATNLVPCVRSVLANEPNLRPEQIIVIDDGARRDAESHVPPIRWVPGIKPFVYARNVNIGIRAAATDVVLLNDDACLLTPRGFTLLSRETRRYPSVGIWSAVIRGMVGNPKQIVSESAGFRLEPRTLAFICVYIPKTVYDQVGLLDERFVGYGFEDNDYCARVLAASLQLAIWDGCVVDHSGDLPSTYRTRQDIWALYQKNRGIFHEKWGWKR